MASTFDREKFNQELEVPYISVKNELVDKIHRQVKPLLLKKLKLNPMQSEGNGNLKHILLDPNLVKSQECLPSELMKTLQSLGVELEFKSKKLTVTYDNLTIEEVFKSLLPESSGDSESNKLSSWSQVGHIAHVNLREHLLPYKFIIGQVLLDKLQPRIKMVVNKTTGIDNTFRNFEMEVLAKIPGEVSTIVEEYALKCRFKFDFAKVYWNPRLHTEHERIVARLRPKMDNLYDVFAGVGPFAVPAAKMKCKVLANDLNPNSYEFLKQNSTLNKVVDYITCFNLDGREFIKSVVSKDLVDEWKAFDSGEECKVKNFHITMNLPALAIEFLDAFNGWMDEYQENIKSLKEESLRLPMIHCYCFVKRKPGSDAEKEILERAEKAIGCKLEKIDNIFHVRNVAPFKEMYRLSFEIPRHLVVQETCDQPATKKQKVS